MKQSILVFIITAGLSSLAFAQQQVWIAAGYEFGMFADGYVNQGQEIETVTSSRGMNIASYNFLPNRFGIFTRGSFLSPKSSWVWNDTGMSKIDFDNHSIDLDIGLIMGIAYRLDFTDDFCSYFGLGVNWLWASAMYSGTGNISYSKETINIGIGGDIGLKVDVSDRFFLQLGSIITFDFARHTVIETYTGTSLSNTSRGLNEKYFMLSARPYFSAGLNFFWQSEDGRRKFISGKPD